MKEPLTLTTAWQLRGYQPIRIFRNLSDRASYHEQDKQPNHKKHKEQNLRDSHGGACDSGEAENSGDKSNNKKNQ